MNMTKSCTCESPPIIDLTSTWDGNEDVSVKDLLRSALSHWGWCHVSLEQSKLPCQFKKVDFVKLFEKAELESLNESQQVRYRGRSEESGSTELAQAEPKQSLEVQRCRCFSVDSPFSSLHQHLDVLHSIVIAIVRILSLPDNLFVHRDPCNGGGCRQRCEHAVNNKCNIDLMRIFMYDPVYPALGSSPHTDWGTWTVVWQDETTVGGLQTYCSAHDRYVNVVLPHHEPKQQDREYFVVHVGDLTSLALAHASRHDETEYTLFPSPKHRVICPVDEPRVSLVYFAYPPPSTSLADIEKALHNHPILVNSHINYDSYFLLKNQAPGMLQEEPKSVYQRILKMPVGEVFSAKWGEVQRISRTPSP